MADSEQNGQPVAADSETWDGMERRQQDCNRRDGDERRSETRDIWDRRSGQDRRGHPLYSPRNRRKE